MTNHAGLLDVLLGDLDFQLAALTHRLAGRHGEVDENLLDLAAVGLHGREAFFEFDEQFDLLTKKTVQHLHNIIQKLADIDGTTPDGWRFAEGQELVGERGGPEGSFFDFPDKPRELALFRHFVHENLRVADHHGEHVVEIMRHAAGELAEGLGALRAAQAGFHLSQFRHIRNHRAKRCAARLRCGDEVALFEQNGVMPTFLACPVFHLKWTALRKNALDFPAVGHAVVGMDE